MAKSAASALMSGAAASATSGKDDGSASQILSDVAAAGKTGSGQGDGAGDLAIAKSGGSGGQDAAAASGIGSGSLAQKAHAEGKTAPGDGVSTETLSKKTSVGLQSLVSKAAASDGAATSPGLAAKAAASTAAAAPAGPCPMTDLAGAEAASVLLGNTVDQEGDAGFLYFSPRRLMGRIRPASVMAKPWDPKAGVLCDGTACGIIRVRRCLDERLSTTTKVGEFQLANGRWAPVLRGNVQGFPTYIPFLDAARTAPQLRAGAKPAGPSVEARSGDGALVDTDRVYLAQRAESGDDARVMFYDRDGRTMDYAVPVPEAVRDGVTINIGWWTLQKGLLCQGSAGDATHPSCYRPKKEGAGHVTLTAQEGRIDLVALADPVLLRPTGDD
ncbi:MAG: hypothetical protein ACRYGP_31555 [Janthinobacterium lividum]